MTDAKTLTIDGRRVALNGERNILEVARNAGIEIPTFCYHSELSVYGACRLCLVDIEGQGVVASCSTTPEADMVVRTHTAEIREMRKITVELLLANHHQSCTTCSKSATCKLLDLARRLGVDTVRFSNTHEPVALDDSNPCLVRDPNKCVLCGDCVRVCHEVQGVGAIDFTHRGASACVSPAFGRDLGGVECVFCGQCARVCPTGAIVPKSAVEAVWAALADPATRVIAQIAPAVRVAAGEAFGLAPGNDESGRLVAALRALGFDAVYDTSFAADLTVIEEANEFLKRKAGGENVPQFTSCCPAWVQFAEQYYPGLLKNLSSCRSPQQMFGSVAKAILPETFDVDPGHLVVVSIMPCTAKKFERGRDEFIHDNVADVDHVLTTQEMVHMIEASGVVFERLEPQSLDLPMGFKTGAGVIFGNSGGVSEAVLRYALRNVDGAPLTNAEFTALRGEDGIRRAEVAIGDDTVRVLVVHGLANARKVADEVEAGRCDADLIEVMACPGGCIGGAGQPVFFDETTKRRRTDGLYNVDRTLQVHGSQDNPFVRACYDQHIGEIGGRRAHDLLHTQFRSRTRMAGQEVAVHPVTADAKVEVTVCVGTSCFLRGSQAILRKLMGVVNDEGLQDRVDIRATFCHETCDRGPMVTVGGQFIEKCSFERAREALEKALAGLGAAEAAPCAGCGGCNGGKSDDE